MHRFPSLSLLGPLVLLGLVGVTAPTLAKNPSSDAAASSAIVQNCDWDRPGHNPFMGDVVAAVDRYQDIPADVRGRLKARMVKRAYDDIVTIRRDSIEGKARYGTTIRDMHFGSHQVCRSVTRSAWSPQMQERGLVYCEGGDCILVPTVCRNVSRIARARVADERAEGDVPAFEIVPPAQDGSVPVALESELPSALPGVDSPPAPASPLGAGGESFVAGAAIGGSGGFFPTMGGPAGTASLGRSPDVNAPHAGAGSEVSTGVSAVPEPETWCLLLGGLGLLGALSRRRRARLS